ncbi:hypothetical protein ACFV2Q_09050 [Streptomyces sp. NPDC059650]|uniref:LppU/SCO3897 family protein n=1 Tax=Streptomyces sp. NPDC059650 TaxID=3346896 RepID=UPI0036A2D7F9
MSQQEIPITLTPQQAAAGVVITLPLQNGTTADLRVPPARDGELVRGQLGTTDVLLRVRIAGAPAPKKTNPLGCLLGLLIAAGLIAGIAALVNDDDAGPTATGSHPTPTRAAPSWSPPALPTLNLPGAPSPIPSAPDPSPYDEGTCLNGTLPDSTTATRVNNVDEVPCSAPDAHYRVIQRFSLTSDMSRCDANPRTQYAFSHRYTRNGVPINEYVYCLVGIGSYARQ